jgi:type II secretory pathway component GspD/PulD (secretin)
VVLVCVLMLGAYARAAVDLTPQLKKLENATINLNVKDADVPNLLRGLATQYGLNMILSPQIQGTVSMRLENVSVESAINEILKTIGARIIEENNILHVYLESEIPAEPTATELVTEIFSPSFVNSEQLKEVLTPFLTGRGRIQLFKDSSEKSTKPQAIIVTDEPDHIEIVRALIKKLDVETRQVLIQAKIVETALSNNELLGVDWTVKANLAGPPFKFGTELAEGGNIKLGTLSFSQFGAVLERLSSNGKTNVLSDISLATMDGESASIHVGEKIPVGVTTIGTGAEGGVSFGTTNIEDVQVGIKLEVTPHILNDGLVVMDVNPTISTVSGFTSLGGGGQSQAPITNQRTAHTNIMLKTGETLVIGGLVQDSTSEKNSKVPLLGDLPLVGGMFRHKNTTKEKTDLIIFITAMILDRRTTDDPGK